jgi:hypothetical protein
MLESHSAADITRLVQSCSVRRIQLPKPGKETYQKPQGVAGGSGGGASGPGVVARHEALVSDSESFRVIPSHSESFQVKPSEDLGFPSLSQ